jgi:phage shock protein A
MEQQKSWFSRPENLTSVIFGLVVAAGCVWAAINLLPFIILAMTNMIYAGVLIAAVCGLLFVSMSPDIHKIAFYGWKMAMRSLTGLIIDMDPISVVETSLKKMQDRLDEANKNKNDVNGQLKTLDAKIASNTQKVNDCMKRAQYAEKANDVNGAKLMALQAQNYAASNKTLGETRSKVAMMSSVLKQMCDAADFNIKKTSSELEIKKEERKLIMSAHKAMTLGSKILNSSPEKEMFDLAMQNMADTANRQLAEIDHIMDVSEGVLKGVDLEKGVMQEDALKMLRQWESDPQSVLLGSSKTVLIQQSNDPSMGAIDVTPVPVGAKPDRFKDLLR